MSISKKDLMNENNKLFVKAQEIAKEMGVGNNIDYIKEVFSILVNLDQEGMTENSKKRYTPIFEMISSDISVTPENAKSKTEKSNIEKVVDELNKINDKK